MSDLRQRVPAQSLIEKLLLEFDAGRIRVEPETERVVIDDESLSWYQGVLGERRVGEQLATLGDDFTVLHSIPFRSRQSDIDHVVIGPGGVTVINTKHSPGRRVWSAGFGIYVGGRAEKGFILNLVDAVREAERRLSKAAGMTVPVRGVLCFVDPARIDRKDAAGGGQFDVPVDVVTDHELVGALQSRRELSDQQVERIVAAALQPGTWHDAPRPSRIGAHIAREFDMLEHEVGSQVARRLSELTALREAERISAKRSRSSNRAGSATHSNATRGGRPSIRRAPSGPASAPRREPTSHGSSARIPTPYSRGNLLLALWPLLVATLFAVSSVAGILVSRGAMAMTSFDQLSVVWLLTFAAPVAFALADRHRLRQLGTLQRQTLLPWILLGPLSYLIARAIVLRSTGRTAGSSIIVHLVVGTVGGILAIAVIMLATLLLLSDAA